MLAGKTVGAGLDDVPVLSLLAYTSALFTASGILFGWLGLAATAAVQLVWVLVRDGSVDIVGTVAYLAQGGISWTVFRYRKGLSRGLHEARSLAWLGAAAIVGSLLSSTAVTWSSHGYHDIWPTVAVWSRSTIVSVLLLVPPLLILGERFLRPWLAPIPGEIHRPMPRRLVLVTHDLGASESPVIQIVASPLRLGRVLALAIVGTAAITAVKLSFTGWGPSLAWWNLLYLAPLYGLSRSLRLRGGLLGAGLVGMAILIGDSLLVQRMTLPEHPEIGQTSNLAVYAELLFVWLVGILLAWGAERETGLLDHLAASHERLRLDLQRVVTALTGALEAKDRYTEGHLQRVNSYALEVGQRFALSAVDLDCLQIAGTLHDLGKIAIPETLLNKPGPLEPGELELMRTHPEVGARILAGIDGLRAAAPLVLHHHERWDGRTDGTLPGYPKGLVGESIPLGSRIIAVVDAFDAMTTHRPYRPALSEQHAREVLLAERGQQFDPRVVDTFLSILEERPWS